MPLISQSTIDEVLSRAKIVEVTSKYTDLREKGAQGKLVGLSPFTNEKTPSFWVDPNKNTFYCFSCGLGGNVVKFVQKIEGINFPEAIRFLADMFNLKIKHE